MRYVTTILGCVLEQTSLRLNVTQCLTCRGPPPNVRKIYLIFEMLSRAVMQRSVNVFGLIEKKLFKGIVLQQFWV